MAEDNQQKDGTLPIDNTSPIPYTQWSTHIPTELKDKGYWEPVKDQPLATVLKNYGHAQERMGKSIVLPDKPDDKDGWSKVFDKIGRPAKPEDYEYTLPEAKDVAWDKGMFTELNKVMHGLGATKDQVKGLVEWFTKDLVTKTEAANGEAKEKAEKVLASIKKDFGSQADVTLAFARRAAELYLGADVGKDFIDRNMADEKLVRGFVKLGKDLAEDGAFGKKPPELEGAISREAAVMQINEIMSNRAHPYWSTTNSPDQQAALKKVEELHKIAYPE